MLKEQVEEAAYSLKARKSPGVDGIPSELLKNGGEATATVLKAIYRNGLKVGRNRLSYLYQRKATSSSIYRTNSLISHPSKTILRVILLGALLLGAHDQ